MSSQSFEGDPEQMGLFTFYKKQQDYEDQSTAHKSKKKRKGTRSKRKKANHQNLPSPQEQSHHNSPEHTCEHFLKSIQLPKKKLKEVSESPYQLEGSILESRRETPSPNFKANRQQVVKEQERPSPDRPESKLSESQAQEKMLIRSQMFKRQSMSSLVRPMPPSSKDIAAKQRIRTQIDRHLQRNHADYIRCAERELVLTSTTRNHPPSHAVPNSQNQSKKMGRVGTQATWEQLHEENKRYFKRLIEYVSPHRQYNQTAYRMLRETLRFPQLLHPSNHPLQMRSRSYSKKPVEEVKRDASKGRLVSKSFK